MGDVWVGHGGGVEHRRRFRARNVGTRLGVTIHRRRTGVEDGPTKRRNSCARDGPPSNGAEGGMQMMAASARRAGTRSFFPETCRIAARRIRRALLLDGDVAHRARRDEWGAEPARKRCPPKLLGTRPRLIAKGD